jgi:DNA-binding NtrC family response regulator
MPASRTKTVAQVGVRAKSSSCITQSTLGAMRLLAMNINTRKSQLLYIGNEPMLNKASAELLKRVGYKVRTTSPRHAVNAIHEAQYVAVVLCATLSSQETEAIVQAVTQLQPEAPIVSIHLGLLGDAPNPSSSIVVDALNGPQALISAVEAVARVQPHSISKAV